MSVRRTIAQVPYIHVYRNVLNQRIYIEFPLKPWKRFAKDAHFVAMPLPIPTRAR